MKAPATLNSAISMQKNTALAYMYVKAVRSRLKTIKTSKKQKGINNEID